MQTSTSRLSAIFSFSSMVFGVLAVVQTITSLFIPVSPSGVVSNIDQTLIKVHPYFKVDQALLTFDLEANVTSLFHWDTKYVFIYVEMDFYSKPWNNSISIWDKIVYPWDPFEFSLKGVKPEYDVSDMQQNTLRGKHAKLEVYWMPMPVVGLLSQDRGHVSTDIVFT